MGHLFKEEGLTPGNQWLGANRVVRAAVLIGLGLGQEESLRLVDSCFHGGLG